MYLKYETKPHRGTFRVYCEIIGTISGEILVDSEDSAEICYEVARKQINEFNNLETIKVLNVSGLCSFLICKHLEYQFNRQVIMKRILSLMVVIMMTSLTAIIYAGTPINRSELPKAAQTFLTKYFPRDGVRKAEKDSGYRNLEYEVDLNSGAEIEFRENGDWKDIKAAYGHAVPAALVPAAISKYVTANFRGQKIVEISRIRRGYEVELSNGTELKLTEDAKPLVRPQRNR